MNSPPQSEKPTFFGYSPGRFELGLDQRLGELSADGVALSGRRALRVDAVEVFAGRDGIGIQHRVAAGRRVEVAAVERIHDGGQFRFGGFEQVRLGPGR